MGGAPYKSTKEEGGHSFDHLESAHVMFTVT